MVETDNPFLFWNKIGLPDLGHAGGESGVVLSLRERSPGQIVDQAPRRARLVRRVERAMGAPRIPGSCQHRDTVPTSAQLRGQPRRVQLRARDLPGGEAVHDLEDGERVLHWARL